MLEMPDRYDVWNCARPLSLLASDSAVVLDNLLAGRKGNYDVIQKLAELLRNEAKSDYVPPCTSMVLYQALRDCEPVLPSKRKISVEDLSLYIGLASQELESAEKLPKERLKTLAHFCSSLSTRTLNFDQAKGRRGLTA